MTIEQVGSAISNFRWAIFDDGKPSQARWETKEDAIIAQRNHNLRRDKE